MPELQLRVLGGFEITAPGEVTLPTRKAEALLTFLALSPGHNYRRDEIAALLWSDRGRDQAHHSLRQTIYLLQKCLADLGVRRLLADRHTLALERAAGRVDAIRMRDLAAIGTPKALLEAAALYRGDLLAGIDIADEAFEEWLRDQRARLRELASDILMRLLRSQQDAGELHEALQTGLRLVGLDPIREDAQRLLIELYFNLGRSDSAARQYREYGLVLRRELGIGPSQATREHFQTIARAEETPARRERVATQSWQPDAAPVLVVALDNRGPDQALRSMAARFVEDLIINLSQARLLTVIAGSERNEDGDLGDVSARYVLIASVAGPLRGARLRLRLQESLGGQVIWAEHCALRTADSSAATTEASTAAAAIIGACLTREKALANSEARHTETAMAYWHEAGQQAAQRFDHKEALAHFARALQLLEGLPDNRARARLEVPTQTAIGISLMAVKGPAPEVTRAFSRARKLSEQLGDRRQLYAALWGLWFFNAMRMKYDEASELSYQLIDLANQDQDRGLLLQGHHSAWTVLLYRGEFAACRRHAEQGRALYDPDQHRSHALMYGGHDPGVCSRYQGSLSLWILGYPDKAASLVRDAVALARELAQPFSEVIALSTSSYVHQFRGEASRARQQAEMTVALSVEQGFPSYLTTGNLLRGWAVATQGEPEAGLSMLRESLAGLYATGTDVRRTYYLALLAEVLGRADQLEEGLHVLGEALEFATANGERWWEAELHRLRGELLLARSRDNYDEAEASVQRAVAIARRQQAKSFELRASTALARLWGERGRRGEAHDLLAPVYGWFTEGFDSADLLAAGALLDELKN
ncbi:MAG: BTAD domain-containing putative transcriptional regulator [Alphaproteobacteria bacterium]|jgi:predicted ATPase/DNA-binding SARP family transcriptional activator|nr:BTAD domain-containing putative transcriptional regulator [Alphaproteobacteria bacterium]MDP6817207.1 BTAD domain-containing putative transcriptional regulator [Alphaproteobacteria bacterium]